jgi:hypothetical protein
MRRMIGVKARVALCAFALVYVASGWVGVEWTIVPSFAVGVGSGLVGCSWLEGAEEDTPVDQCPHSPKRGLHTYPGRFSVYFVPDIYVGTEVGHVGVPLYFVPLAWLPWPLWKAASRRRRRKRGLCERCGYPRVKGAAGGASAAGVGGMTGAEGGPAAAAGAVCPECGWEHASR